MKKKKFKLVQTINFLVVEKKGYETSSISSCKFGDVFGSVFSSRLSSSDFFLGGGVGGGHNYASSIQQFWLKCQYFMLMIFKQEFLN